MKKINILRAGLVLLLSTSAWAQQKDDKEPRGPVAISVNVDGLNCNSALGAGTFAVQAWTFGATQTVSTSTGGGAGAGKANISDLNVQKQFDECSPLLFNGVTTGKHFQKVTLVQQDKKSTLMTVTLTDVLISSYQISGSGNDPSPNESVSFNFAKICFNNTASGTQACFDMKTNTAQ